MELAQGQPPRKRRRWLIVAFVLVLLSLGTWWYWPRGDARFVGKWTAHYPDGKHFATITLYSNGSGITDWVNGKPHCRFHWEGNSQRLILGLQLPFKSYFDRANDWLRKQAFRTFATTADVHRVKSLTENEIILNKYNSIPPVSIYRRISE